MLKMSMQLMLFFVAVIQNDFKRRREGAEHKNIPQKYKIQQKGTHKENPKQQNYKCCRLGLFEPVHGR